MQDGPGTDTLPKLIDQDALIEAAQKLEPLPSSVTRLANIVAEEDAKMNDIVEIIMFDQALTGALLRQANSAASASHKPIGTVREAVVRLGTGTVLSLALGSCVARKMQAAIPAYNLGEGQLWAHSVAASIAAETIRSQAGEPLPGELITAALIHDIGKLVMAQFFDATVLVLLHEAEHVARLSRQQAEIAVLELHHGELAALVVQHWGLPDSIRRGVQYHHTPELDGSALCYAVQLADVLAHDVLAHDPIDVDADVRDEEIERAAELRDEGLRQVGIRRTSYSDLLATVSLRYQAHACRYLTTS